MAATLDTISTQLQGLQEVLDKLAGSFSAIGKSAAEATGKMAAFGAAIYGVARAGLAGTTEGARLATVWTYFSRQIASVFLPVIDLAVTGLTRLTEWFRSLTGEGQSLAMNIGLASVGMKLLGPALVLLKGILSPIAIAVGLLFEGLMQFFTGTAEGQALLSALSSVMEMFTPIIGAFGEVFRVVVDALVVAFQFMYRAFVQIAIWIGGLVETILDWVPGMGEATEAVKRWRQNAQANLDAMENKGFGADAKVNKGKDKREVNPTGFNFESLSASFERITSDANKKDLSLEVAKDQLAEQKKTNELIAKNGWGETSGGGGDY